jgi:hypothetical protein
LDISFVLLNISSNYLLHLVLQTITQKAKQVNRLNRPKDILVSLRRVIRLSQWFITLRSLTVLYILWESYTQICCPFHCFWQIRYHFAHGN